MRYYDLIETPKTGKTFLEGGENRIHQSDSRVSLYFTSVDITRFKRGFDNKGYPTIAEIERDVEAEKLEQEHAEFKLRRDGLLAEVDIAINKAFDEGKPTAELSKYRIALRDATKTWVLPKKPKGV